MRAFLIRVAAVLALGDGGASAAPVQRQREHIAARDRCDPATAIRTSVAAIRAAPRRYVGRCVTIVAPSNGYALYASSEELERFERVPRQETGFDMIGVYLPSQVHDLRDLLDRNLVWTLTGRVDTCERIRARTERRYRPRRRAPRAGRQGEDGPISMIIVPGYCHTRDGPVLSAHSALPHL